MPSIRVETFKGMFPRTTERQLLDEAAQVAQNCDLRRGKIVAVPKASARVSVPQEVRKSLIYKGQYHYLPWFADAFPSEIQTGNKDFICFQIFGELIDFGDGCFGPRKKSKDQSFATASPLGIAPPATALTITIEDTSPPIDDMGKPVEKKVVDSISFAYTYVTDRGEESAPSPATGVIDLKERQQVYLSGFVKPSDRVVAFRIYMTSEGNEATDFQLLDEVDSTIAVQGWNPLASRYSVNMPGEKSDLGEAIPSETWYPPPGNYPSRPGGDHPLHGIVQVSSGILAGWRLNEVWFSQPGVDYAWNPGDMKTCDQAVVALGYFGSTVVALTDSNPYLFQGQDPASMTQTRLPHDHPCISRTSVVNTKYGVVYASWDGLVVVNEAGATVVTSGIMNKEQWAQCNPKGMVGVYFDDHYYGFPVGSQLCFVVNPTAPEEGMTIINLGDGVAVRWAFYDITHDSIVLITYEGGAYYRSSLAFSKTSYSVSEKMTYAWRSKVFTTKMPISFSCARIIGSQSTGEPLTLTLYADGILRFQRQVTSRKVFRVPGGYTAREWEFMLTGTSDVESFVMATSMGEITN